MNFNLSDAMRSSTKPTYNHTIALVGRTAQANAATAKAHLLELEDILPELTLMHGQ